MAPKPHSHHDVREEERLIDLSKIFAIVKKNYMVLKEDKIRFVMLMLFPLIMITLYGFTAGQAPKHIAAAIVDYDNTPTSLLVQSRLYSYDLFSIKYQVGSQDEGKRLVEEGKAKILFVIPPGFEEDIREGRTAQISIILEQADPNVAQITRGYTQNFVQSISQESSASRIAQVSHDAYSTDSYILSASNRLSQISSRSDEEVLAKINSDFRSGTYVSSKSGEMMSDAILGLQNSLGYVVDQNEIAASYRPGMDTKATMAALASGDAQQAVYQQIGTYGALLGANRVVTRDMSSIYSGANQLAATAQSDRASVSAAYAYVELAGKQIDAVAEDARKAAVQPISLFEIQPYGSGRPGLDFLLPSILALIGFQGAVMLLGRAVAGERQDGSLTRVFLTPTSNFTIIVGTLLFYIIFETLRSMFIVFLAIVMFGVTVKGSFALIFLVVFIYAAGATGLGMVLSVLSRSQEQYMAISMLVTLPSMFLSGVFLPIETMPPVIQGVTYMLPITYAAEALRGIMIKGFEIWQIIPDITFLAGFAIATIVLSLTLFKRELM